MGLRRGRQLVFVVGEEDQRIGRGGLSGDRGRSERPNPIRSGAITRKPASTNTLIILRYRKHHVGSLRRPHDHHRDLRARLPAKASPHTCSADNPDRHLMRPSPSIDNCSDTYHSRRLSAGSARAPVEPPESSALSPRFLSSSLRPTHLLLHAPSLPQAQRSRRPLRSTLLKPHPAAKSP